MNIEDDIITVETIACIRCGKGGTVKVLRRDYNLWKNGGRTIQEAFAEVPAGIREQLMSGIHDKCFDEMFADKESY